MYVAIFAQWQFAGKDIVTNRNYLLATAIIL
jgi:hypothetical protein